MQAADQDSLRFGDFTLPDPGWVSNTRDGEHCVHACFQMIFRARIGGVVPSFAELDRIMQKLQGKYTWELGLLAQMPSHGFDTRITWTIDLKRLRDDPERYLLEHFGHDVGTDYVANSNLSVIQAQADELMSSGVRIETRIPDLSEITRSIMAGYYLTVTINQRVLQADPGYAAHSILIYGVSSRGVRVHNPGPPSAMATELPWDLFDKAWSYPTVSARNIMACRPTPLEEG